MHPYRLPLPTLLIASLYSLNLCADSSTPTPAGEIQPSPAWENELDLGLNGASGNSDSLSLHAGFNSQFKSDAHLFKFTSAYDRSSTDNVKSRSQFFAEALKDWLVVDSPWFVYAQGRYDWDEFKDWNSRIALSAGAGYQFLKNSSWDISGRFGLGGNRTYGGTEDEWTTEALLGLKTDWSIGKQESLSFTTTFYPSLENSGEFRNITTLDWKLALKEDNSLAMKIGLSNEYDSEAAEDIENNDFKYYLSLVWGL